MPVSFSSRIVVGSDVLYRAMEDESVLLNLKTQASLGLDAVGTRMWAVLRNSNSIEEAYETLSVEYDVDRVRLRQDLVDFLDQLQTEGLIEVVAQGSTADSRVK